jgi:putative radical SAM enzyme (TIGR03279 family)
MAQQGVQVIAVEPDGLAADIGLQPGDTILEINGEKVLDQLSYQFLISQKDETALLYRKADGGLIEAEVDNGGDGIGLDLAADEVKTCKMNCVFCFVHQMPKGYRKSLYLKDEDIRLSFLYGHFSTLSSSDDAELDRIIRERLSPIHVSVHATDPEARIRTTGNPKEGHILRKIDRLLEGGIDVHTQAVIAPGYNDGGIWEKTLAELWERRAFQETGSWAGKGGVLSLSCVPLGLTAHREGLPQVQDIGPAYAEDWVARWTPEARHLAKENGGEPWLLLADEWFTRARVEVPGRAFYSRTWAQLENGVGMVRKFQDHAKRFLQSKRAEGYRGRRALLLTGSSFAPILNRTLMELNRQVGSQLRAMAVQNNDFGDSVTVAGLLTGRDLQYAAHADRTTSGARWVDTVVVPSSSLRTHTGPTDQYTLHGQIARAEGAFLDDMTLAELSGELQVPVVPSGANLAQLLDHLEAADRLRAPIQGRDLSRVFHPEGLNLPQGAYNP